MCNLKPKWDFWLRKTRSTVPQLSWDHLLRTVDQNSSWLSDSMKLCWNIAFLSENLEKINFFTLSCIRLHNFGLISAKFIGQRVFHKINIFYPSPTTGTNFVVESTVIFRSPQSHVAVYGDFWGYCTRIVDSRIFYAIINIILNNINIIVILGYTQTRRERPQQFYFLQ